MLFDNNASGTNSVQIEIVDTLITLQTSEGALFPPVTTASGDFFYATFENTTGDIEIVKVTNNVSDIFTVTRAQENTTAQLFVVGSKVEQRTTAATYDEFLQRTGAAMTGQLTMDGNTIENPVLSNTGSGTLQGFAVRGSDNGTGNELIVPSAGGTVTIGTQTVWHAGNDGTGTGLDADLLDGVEGTGYVKEADATVTFTGTVTLDDDVTTADYGTGGRVKDGTDVAQPIGFNVMPVAEVDASSTFDLGANGKLIHKDTVAAADFTLPNDGDIPQGATWVVVCDAVLGANLFRIKGATGVTVRWFDQENNETTDVVAGNGFTLSDATVATVYKYSDTVFFLWGGGIIESV